MILASLLFNAVFFWISYCQNVKDVKNAKIVKMPRCQKKMPKPENDLKLTFEIWLTFELWVKFSPTRPSGPICSSSRHVRVCVFICLCVPFPCDLFWGLSLALRSHDQFEASDWSTLLHYQTIYYIFLFYRHQQKIIMFPPFKKMLP